MCSLRYLRTKEGVLDARNVLSIGENVTTRSQTATELGKLVPLTAAGHRRWTVGATYGTSGWAVVARPEAAPVGGPMGQPSSG